MNHHNGLVIALKSVAFQDRHRIVTGLSEDYGRITAIAHSGAQSKRFGGGVTPFALGKWRWVEKSNQDYGTLEEIQVVTLFSGLAKEYVYLSLASCWNELILKCAPDKQPIPELFKFHINALTCLDSPLTSELQPNDYATGLMEIYLLKLLQWMGLQPKLKSCLGCQRHLAQLSDFEELEFSISLSGWYCPNCSSSKNFSISAKVVRSYAKILAQPFRQSATDGLISSKATLKWLKRYYMAHVPGIHDTFLSTFEKSLVNFSL